MAPEQPQPPWCGWRPPSVYAYIQREYWDVGFLRFYSDPARVSEPC
jgi:phosphatidylinositol glycan class V